MASIKKNIILNGINTVIGILIPIVTFPYAARVLMPEGIGVVNFLNSIIGYITLFTFLGIPMYAIKEVAKYRDDKQARDTITLEILTLSTILCVFGYIAVWALATFVPRIQANSTLFYVLSLTVIFTDIGVNWFYQGIEDFKFITIRGTIVRLMAAIALFIFVRQPSDLLAYCFVIVGTTVGNNAINFVHLRKHIAFRAVDFRSLKIRRHIAPAFQVFVLNLIISLYVQLNTIMLGFISGDAEVGYFTAGSKISHIGLMLLTSVGGVLMPRCANLIKKGETEEFASVIRKTLNFMLMFSLPIAAGLIVLATPVTMIFCGNEFAPSIPVLWLNAPVIIFISLTNIMGIQVLYPMDKTAIVIWSTVGAAVVNIIFNIILIPPFGAVGASASTLLAEFAILIIQAIIVRKYYPFKTSELFNGQMILASLVMCLSVWFVIRFLPTYTLQLLIGIPLGAIVYFAVLGLMKNSTSKAFLQMARGMIPHK